MPNNASGDVENPCAWNRVFATVVCAWNRVTVCLEPSNRVLGTEVQLQQSALLTCIPPLVRSDNLINTLNTHFDSSQHIVPNPNLRVF